MPENVTAKMDPAGPAYPGAAIGSSRGNSHSTLSAFGSVLMW